ncbi:hypothetical protein [Planctomycetes bacterium Pla163]|uniref:hypothetical protein n=1 Tax=Rohdeia mirabilis TaxID=2528008 RepID=UPI0011A9D72D
MPLWTASACDGDANERASVPFVPQHVEGWVERTTFDDLPTYVWCEPGYAGPIPEAWRAAFGGVSASRGRLPDAAAGGGWRAYVGHAAPRAALFLERSTVRADRDAWLRERTESSLPQRPAQLASPFLLAEIERVAEQRTRALPNADFVALGDEVGVTPFGDPLEFARPGELPCTDEALGLLGGPDVAGFLARRRADQAELLAALERAAQGVRRAAPSAAVGLLGNGPRTPFGGVGAADLVDRFEVLEPYPAGLIRAGVLLERARPTAKRARVLRTVFDESGPACRWQVWEHVLRGGDGLVLWWRPALAERPELVGALAEAVGAARAFRGRLGPTALASVAPRIAVLTDFEGDAGLWLAVARGERLHWPARLAGFEAAHGPAFERRRAWVRAFEDAGLQCGALAVERLATASSPPVELAVASALELARPDVRAALVRHLDAGGHLLIDDENDAGEARALERQYPTRVHRAPLGIDRVMLDRVAGRIAGPRSLRLEHGLRELAVLAGVPAPPARLVASDGRALLQNWFPCDDGGWVGIAVESADSPTERASLSAFTAQLEWSRTAKDTVSDTVDDTVDDTVNEAVAPIRPLYATWSWRSDLDARSRGLAVPAGGPAIVRIEPRVPLETRAGADEVRSR